MSHKKLFTGGRVFTADQSAPWAQAVLIEGERIAFVGDQRTAIAMAGPDAGVVDCQDCLIIPGFVDGHVHVTMTGASMLKAQLRGAGDLNEIQRRVKAWADAHPDAPRVLGTNWVHGDIPDARPTRDCLLYTSPSPRDS